MLTMRLFVIFNSLAKGLTVSLRIGLHRPEEQVITSVPLAGTLSAISSTDFPIESNARFSENWRILPVSSSNDGVNISVSITTRPFLSRIVTTAAEVICDKTCRCFGVNVVVT